MLIALLVPLIESKLLNLLVTVPLAGMIKEIRCVQIVPIINVTNALLQLTV